LVDIFQSEISVLNPLTLVKQRAIQSARYGGEEEETFEWVGDNAEKRCA